MSIDSFKAEELAKWYLRSNGYFLVDNFIVHAGDDPSRISNGIVAPHTETDILGIRNINSREETGDLVIQNDPLLIESNKVGETDFLIAEVKTGNQNKPNKPWIKRNKHVIKYILRFAGLFESEEMISKVANELADKGCYLSDDRKYSVRVLLISENSISPNYDYISNIEFNHIIDFLVEVRGSCWIESKIGIASVHYQWNQLIKEIFDVANDQTIELKTKKEKIFTILKTATKSND